MILDGIILKINKKKVQILISNETCKLTLFIIIKYLCNINNKINVCFLLTYGHKKEEIANQISLFELKNMSFNEYCISCIAGNEIVNKTVSDSMYIESNPIKGWEFVFEKDFFFYDSDTSVIREKKKEFLSKYINEI